MPFSETNSPPSVAPPPARRQFSVTFQPDLRVEISWSSEALRRWTRATQEELARILIWARTLEDHALLYVGNYPTSAKPLLLEHEFRILGFELASPERHHGLSYWSRKPLRPIKPRTSTTGNDSWSGRDES